MNEFNNDITYPQLINFHAIYEAGNISKAAKRLSVSSASVSQSLKLLEKQINEPLFVRTTRAIKPTELGVQLYESTHGAIGELSLAVEHVCERHNVPKGTLSLNMAKNIYDQFLKDVLWQFQRDYPSIELDITLSDTMDQRVEKSIDIGFRFGETLADNMIARPLNPLLPKVKLAIFAAPEFIHRYGMPTTVEQLQQLSMIKFRAPTSGELFPITLHKTTDQNSEIITLANLKTAMIVNNTDVMLDMTRRGLGVGFLMDRMASPYFNRGELLPILPEHWCDLPNVYMYYAPENRQSTKVRCFLTYLEQSLGQ